MALTALNTVRQAELDSRKRIEEVHMNVNKAEILAKEKAEDILNKAKKLSQERINAEKSKAIKKAEEIIANARNSAMLDAENLKINSYGKQDFINKKIISLII